MPAVAPPRLGMRLGLWMRPEEISTFIVLAKPWRATLHFEPFKPHTTRTSLSILSIKALSVTKIAFVRENPQSKKAPLVRTCNESNSFMISIFKVYL